MWVFTRPVRRAAAVALGAAILVVALLAAPERVAAHANLERSLPPADLSVHVPLHSDRQLFVWIRDGMPGTAMPAFRDQLTAEERWHLLHYLKGFTPQEQ